MSKCKCVATDNTFPELAARTGQFRMGAPRSFVLRSSVHTVGFTRSADGYSSALDIWLVTDLKGQPIERCLVRSADLLADEIFRRANARLRIHINARVAEEARREDRDRHERRRIAEERHCVRR